MAVAVGFYLESPVVTALWPFPVTHLTYVFLAGIVAAFAAPVLWIAWSGEIAALAGEGMTAAVAFAGMAVLLLSSAGDGRVAAYVVAAAVLAVVAVTTVIIAMRRPFRDPRPTPPAIRIAFVAFVAVLVVAGGLALVGVPNILPWKIDGTNAALVGWIFIADAAYFLYGVVRPVWANAAGQLLAFAAYDVVLLPAFTGHLLNGVVPEQRVSLVLYLAVLVASLAIAVAAYVVVGRLRRSAAIAESPVGG